MKNSLIISQLEVVGTVQQSDLDGSRKLLVTHNGRFHCDDAFAIGLLLFLSEYHDAIVVRTRDEKLIKKGAVVVDVGGIHDPETLRFDHHQSGFCEYFDPENPVTKMSSVGLVYKHFGKRILLENFDIPLDMVDLVHLLLYKSLIEAIDAIDNGVGITPPGAEPLYKISTDLSTRVARLNPDWLTWDGQDEVQANEFIQAIQLALNEFNTAVFFYRNSWIPSLCIVKTAYESRFLVHPKGSILILSTGCPYELSLELLEEESRKMASLAENPPVPLVYFVVYPNDNSNNSWRLKTVRAKKNSFESRLPLPERYRGRRAPQIDISGVNFVHHSGFLAGATSKESAIELACLTLQEAGLCDSNSVIPSSSSPRDTDA